MQEREVKESGDRGDERGICARAVRLDLDARYGRERPAQGGGNPPPRYAVATVRPRPARRSGGEKGQRDSEAVCRQQGGRNHLRGGEVAGLVQVQPAALQADVHLAAQKRCDGCKNHRRGGDGREVGHELLGVHGYPVREHRPA